MGWRSTRVCRRPPEISGKCRVCKGSRRLPSGPAVCRVRVGMARAMGSGRFRRPDDTDARRALHIELEINWSSQHRGSRLVHAVVLQLRQPAWSRAARVRPAGGTTQSWVPSAPSTGRSMAVPVGRPMGTRCRGRAGCKTRYARGRGGRLRLRRAPTLAITGVAVADRRTPCSPRTHQGGSVMNRNSFRYPSREADSSAPVPSKQIRPS